MIPVRGYQVITQTELGVAVPPQKMGDERGKVKKRKGVLIHAW